MLKIKFNHDQLEISENTLLADLLSTRGYQSGGFAVAVNRVFIPRTLYSQTKLCANDHIEIIEAMQGG